MVDFIVENTNIEKIAKSGQCFNISVLDDGEHFIPSGERACWAFQEGENVRINCEDADEEYWKKYFDVGNPMYKKLEAIGKDESHSFLKAALEYGKGLRILNQDPFECLISFIVSQRKSIPAIVASLDKLCIRYGKGVASGSVFYDAFPEPKALVEGYSKDTYGDCGLGYRDRYVYEASSRILSGELDLGSLVTVSYDVALEELMKLPGVGYKVANCVCLYSLKKNNAFPVDVWMARILDGYFSDAEYQDMLKRYDGVLGLLQLYMFYYGRNNI